MKNIEQLLAEYGMTIPEGKQTDFLKAVTENYITRAEHDKKIQRLEGERDSEKTRADTAETTLRSFEGIDPGKLQDEINTWKSKAEQAKKDYDANIAARDFEDALKGALEKVKFSSEAAKKSVASEIREAGLKLHDGKILGLTDLLDQMKERDASAFVSDEQEQAQQNAARFTQPAQQGGAGGRKAFKDMSLDERIKLHSENPELYRKLKG